MAFIFRILPLGKLSLSWFKQHFDKWFTGPVTAIPEKRLYLKWGTNYCTTGKSAWGSYRFNSICPAYGPYDQGNNLIFHFKN